MSVKVKLVATIPVVQYGNIQPEIEAEADDYEGALQIAESRLVEIWNKYVESGKELKTGVSNNRVKLRAFVGGDYYYNAAKHEYSNEAGEVYLSGSQYAESFKKPFNKQGIAQAMAKKSGASADEIIKMWELKGQASRDFGSAIHAALQLEEQYRALGEKLGKSGAHEHPILKHAVDGFLKDHKGEKALNEVVVVDHEEKRAGTIDRLLVLGKDKCRVQDFKTSATLKDIETYWKQLEFYARILTRDGWVVEGVDIFHYNGKWETYSQ